MHKACHQLCLDRKSVNTKRLSPYPPGKGVAKSFPQLGLAASLLGRHCNTATRSESVAGLAKRLLSTVRRKADWIPVTSQRWMGNGRTIWIADAHRGHGIRYPALTTYKKPTECGGLANAFHATSASSSL